VTDLKDDVAVARRLTVSYDGHTIQLPTPDGLSIACLYKRWLSAGSGKEFEVRDCSGRLIAVGMRLAG
jgi:hypothetical protein